jgi:hypothetical protein
MLSKLAELFRLKGRLRRPLCGKPAAFRANARILTFSLGAKAEPSRPARAGWFCFLAPGRAEPFRTASGEAAFRIPDRKLNLDRVEVNSPLQFKLRHCLTPG